MHFSVIPVINTLLSIFSDNSVDLTCPKSVIKYETRTGSFPVGGLAQFPANYDCGIEFEIPPGYVVKYRIQTTVEEPGDKIVVRDSLSSLHEFTSDSSIFYVPAEHAKISIKTESSSSSFHFTWEYINVSDYQEVKQPVGEVMSLNLTLNHYYRFEIESLDRYSPIQLRTGSLSGVVDSSLSKIFVYDGNNLESKFVGTLEQIASTTKEFKSTGNSFTIVNFYRLPSNSYVIANVFPQFYSYDLIIISKKEVFRRMMNSASGSSVTTFYCVDSDETYLTDLKFVSQSTELGISFSPFTPSEGKYDLFVYGDRRVSYLVYSSYDNRFDPQSLPQQILTNTFTMTLHKSEVEVELKSGPLENYSQVAPGRKGKVIPPSNWNPEAASATFYTNFTASESVKFVIDLSIVHLESPLDKLIVEIGTGNRWETPQLFNLKGYGRRVAIGKNMAITFIRTSNESDFTLSYRVEASATTRYPYETASMSSSVTFGFSVLALLVALFL